MRLLEGRARDRILHEGDCGQWRPGYAVETSLLERIRSRPGKRLCSRSPATPTEKVAATAARCESRSCEVLRRACRCNGEFERNFASLNATPVLLLANHIGDLEAIAAAVKLAHQRFETKIHHKARSSGARNSLNQHSQDPLVDHPTAKSLQLWRESAPDGACRAPPPDGAPSRPWPGRARSRPAEDGRVGLRR